MKGVVSLLGVLYSFPVNQRDCTCRSLHSFLSQSVSELVVAGDQKRLALGWTWMARMLNTPPILISAELVCAFLEVRLTRLLALSSALPSLTECAQQSGYYLCRRYRTQFAKMVLLMQQHFIPTLSSATAAAFASKTRVQLLVEKMLTSQFNLEVPKGAHIEQRNDFDD